MTTSRLRHWHQPILLATIGLVVGAAPAALAQAPQAPATPPPVTVIRPQEPTPPARLTPTVEIIPGAVPAGVVLDPEDPVEPPAKAKQRPAPPAKKKKGPPPPPSPAPVEQSVPLSADHDDRASSRFWVNLESPARPMSPACASAITIPVMDWAQSMPAIIPREDGTFSPSQRSIIESLCRRPTALHGFLRYYRRTTLPSSLCATLWIGGSQTSPLQSCVIVRVPANRLPPQVNEFFLTGAAARGWPIRVKGFPTYQMNTKYRVGIDRMIPWELDPVESCEIQSTADGVSAEGSPTVWRQLTAGPGQPGQPAVLAPGASPQPL